MSELGVREEGGEVRYEGGWVSELGVREEGGEVRDEEGGGREVGEGKSCKSIRYIWRTVCQIQFYFENRQTWGYSPRAF